MLNWRLFQRAPAIYIHLFETPPTAAIKQSVGRRCIAFGVGMPNHVPEKLSFIRVLFSSLAPSYLASPQPTNPQKNFHRHLGIVFKSHLRLLGLSFNGNALIDVVRKGG